jgi:AhpD family alkylhydroperoxidase
MKKQRFEWSRVLPIVIVLALCTPQLGFSGSEESGTDTGESRATIYAEMESTLGLVPTFFKTIPDSSLKLEWEMMKQVQMAPGPIPNKYRELIGVAVAAATKCEYCVYFHTEFARLNGATEEEIEDALHYTKSITGWSTYINGSQLDIDVFRAEVKAIVEHVRKNSAAAAKQ